MPSNHDWGIDCEQWCGGTPDDEPQNILITCIHSESGLCPACQEDFDADPEAWFEFGDHPAGIERWEALQAEIREGLADEARQAGRRERNYPEIPF